MFFGHTHDFAQAQQTWEVEVEGVPVWITIFQIEDSDRSSCLQWWECGNTTTDAYIFAIGQPDNIQLILDFDDKEGDFLRANLYIAEDPTQPIKYVISGAEVEVLSTNGFPYLTWEARDNRWVNEAGPNYNLDISIDGAYNQGEYGNPDSLTDGTTDFTMRIRADESGVPAWQIISVVNDPYTPAQRGWPWFISWLMMPDRPDFKLQAPFMPSFPLFGIGAQSNWFQENPWPVAVDVSSMNIRINPFVTFQIGGTYAINSINPAPYVNFEAPFAFYNFNPDTRQAHLVVRGGYSPDEAPLGIDLPSPRLGVRYSWKTDDDQRWRYGLQLSDFHGYSDEMLLGDTKIIAVQPEEWPEWVVSKPWRAITFIEVTEGYSGSEGVYFYAADTDDWLWIAGKVEAGSGYLEAPLLQETTELTAFGSHTLPAGFRGEYMVANAGPPSLYLSPVDSMLHLVGAQGGVWYLGNNILLRSTDIDGDGVLDAWTREIVPSELDEVGELPRAFPGEIIDALYDTGGYLLHSAGDSVAILQAAHNQTIFTIAPPTDKESWEFFRTQLRPYESQRRDPADLRGWLDAFPGPRSEVNGATLANLRIIDGDFRFELTLEPNAQITGPDLLGLAGLPTGEYLVENRDGAFSIRPLTPAQLTIDLRQPAADASVQVVVENTGAADANGLFLVVETSRTGGASTQLLYQPVDALAGESTRALVTVPSNTLAGSVLSAHLEDDMGLIIAEATPLLLPDAPSAGHSTIFSISHVPALWPVVGAFAALLAVAGLMAIRRQGDIL